MNERRFDAWTRRRFGFGLATGGVAASLAGLLTGAADTAARKKRNRKRNKCKPN